jgi:hypothetical protein
MATADEQRQPPALNCHAGGRGSESRRSRQTGSGLALPHLLDCRLDPSSMAAEMAERDNVLMEETDVDRCAMGADCYCPEGPSVFTEKRHPPDVWNRSKDHFPILRKDGGTLVRLMHNRCNKVDYKILDLEAHLLSLRDEDGQPLDQCAVDSAMETHLRLRAENSGTLPRGHRAHRSASREAQEMHASVRRFSEPPRAKTPLLDRWRARSSNVMREAAAAVGQQEMSGQPDKPI